MSRSYKHVPIGGWTKSGSNLLFRSYENRRKRRRVTQTLHVGNYDSMPDEKKYGNEWDSPRDGKTYFGTLLFQLCSSCRWLWSFRQECTCDEREDYYQELMRK